MSQQIAVAPFGHSVEAGYNSSNHTILMKFSFTNPNHIPAGIPEKRRAEDAVVDDNHAITAEVCGYGHLAQAGRVRAGRVDTGEHFIDNVHNIHAGAILRGLANVGYSLSQCHWFFKPGKNGSSSKYVVVIGLSTKEDKLDLPNGAIEQRRKLASTCWQWCHGWANPDGVITLNFGGRMPDGKPQHSVVVRNHQLTAARVTELVTEENE